MERSLHSGVVRQAPTGRDGVGAGLARLVRLLTAVLLMGTALLVVALVGQGVAGARELPTAGPSGWRELPSRPAVVPETPEGTAFAQRWTTAHNTLDPRVTAALPAVLAGSTAGGRHLAGQPSRPGNARSELSPPEWWLAERPRPPAVEDQPAETRREDEDDGFPPGMTADAIGDNVYAQAQGLSVIDARVARGANPEAAAALLLLALRAGAARKAAAQGTSVTSHQEAEQPGEETPAGPAWAPVLRRGDETREIYSHPEGHPERKLQQRFLLDGSVEHYQDDGKTIKYIVMPDGTVKYFDQPSPPTPQQDEPSSSPTPQQDSRLESPHPAADGTGGNASTQPQRLSEADVPQAQEDSRGSSEPSGTVLQAKG
ncbi:MAG TPA: hypothetical protein VKG45_00305, partial [Actinomycetes bacterium]|nr:hypothetical protein [Actinomycetes bacterium]